MGLDMVEFVMAVEDAFGLAIADADAAYLRTPREVIDHVTRLLPTAATDRCLTQRAFYQLRRATVAELGLERANVCADTSLAAVFGSDAAPAWQAVRTTLGAQQWPRIGRDRWLRHTLTPRLETFKQLAEFVVERNPTVLKRDDPGWTRAEVAEVVNRLIRSEFGARDYDEDSSFIGDMHLD
jgi:hypothetical protein